MESWQANQNGMRQYCFKRKTQTTTNVGEDVEKRKEEEKK
jgi:hypothetical protein